MCQHFNELHAKFRKAGWSGFQNARQIKGECQLTDLTKGVDFTSQKFDEFEKEWREKDAIIATLQSKLKSASMKVEDLERKKWTGKSNTPGEIVF